MNCPYCVAEEVNYRTLAETKLSRAFLTNAPIVPGHTLIVPTRHIATMNELTAQELGEINQLRLRLTTVFKKVFQAEGFNYACNEGSIAGQTVPHLHFHIVPRKKDDEGILGYEPRKFLYRPGSREASPRKELEDITRTVKENL